MKWACDTKYVNIEDVGCEADRLNSLLSTVYNNYFSYSEEWAFENAKLLATEYQQFSDLVSIALGLMQDLQETISIVQQNLVSAEGIHNEQEKQSQPSRVL